MKEFVGLTANGYSYLTNNEDKRAKRIKNN